MRCDLGGAAAQDLAERMLGDSKVEVADLAAATLSGFLRAAPPAVAAAARARYSAAARDASATQRLKRRRHKDADTSSAEGKGPQLERTSVVVFTQSQPSTREEHRNTLILRLHCQL